MNEDLQHKFESIFAQVIDTDCGQVELKRDPFSVSINMADGFSYECAFHFAIKYSVREETRCLAFRYISSDELVSRRDVLGWFCAVKSLPNKWRVCLVTDKGFTREAWDFLSQKSVFIGHRLILAKYCGEDAQSLVLNRLWTDALDPRGRVGVLLNDKPCAGAVLSMRDASYNAIGILSELKVPIKKELEFKCPYIRDEYIEDRAMSVLNAHKLTESDIYDNPDYLWRIAKSEGLEIKVTDMGAELFGEYIYKEKTIYLNSRERLYGPSFRERFTLAHELGHHFLHGDVLLRFNYIAAEDQESLNIVGSSNDQIRYFERQANKFASYILMPGNVLDKYAKEVMGQLDIRKGYVYDDDQRSPSEGSFNHRTAMCFISAVAIHFNVSKEAARYRLKELGLLREGNTIDKLNIPLFMR